jgi:hypothetical protein
MAGIGLGAVGSPDQAQGKASAKCSNATATALLSSHRKGSRKPALAPKKVLCGSFAGHDVKTMVVALAAPGCGLVRGWVAFRFEGGTWRLIWSHKGAARGISASKNQIEETAPLRRSDGSCQSYGSKWRLWRWDGKRFVPGPWHEVRGGAQGGRGGRKRLVLSPAIARLPAGGSAQFRAHLFEGGRDLGDVTDETKLSFRKQDQGCAPWLPLRGTGYCYDLLGSCDQATFVCSAISPGNWLLFARYPRLKLRAEASLVVEPKRTLAVTPSEELDPALPGFPIQQQFEVTGAAGPVTWEGEFLSNAVSSSGTVKGAGELSWDGFSLNGSTGFLSSHGTPAQLPWTRELNVRVWDTAGNSGERQYKLSTVAPPPCATACAFAGAKRSVGIAWKPESNCASYSYRLYENGTPWPYFTTASPLTTLPSGQLWFLIPSDVREELSPGEAVAAEVICDSFQPVGTSNTVIVQE